MGKKTKKQRERPCMMDQKQRSRGWISVLNKVVRRDLREKVGFQQRLEVDIWEESVRNRENSQDKGPKEGVDLLYLRNKGEGLSKRQNRGDDVKGRSCNSE